MKNLEERGAEREAVHREERFPVDEDEVIVLEGEGARFAVAEDVSAEVVSNAMVFRQGSIQVMEFLDHQLLELELEPDIHLVKESSVHEVYRAFVSVELPQRMQESGRLDPCP